MTDPSQGHQPPIVGSPVKPVQQELTLPPWLFAGPIVSGRQLVLDIILVCLWVAVSDFLLYQVSTFLAWSVFLVWSVAFFALTKRAQGHRSASLLTAVLLLILSIKLVWCGGWLQVACGLFLIVCYAMALTGSPPFIPEVGRFGGHVLIGAINRLSRCRFYGWRDATHAVQPVVGWQFVMPLAAVTVFGTLFVLANPDMASFVARKLEMTWDSFSSLWATIGISQAFFWFVSAWLMLGLLYPTGKWLSGQWLLQESAPQELSAPAAQSKLYSAYRNTLLSVIILFIIYLVFEFATLWRRDFPEDFYYAGYAHAGAFWLTVALALATGLLSVIFRGSTLSDPRLSRLKSLAGAWSSLNFLLSLAVFNRLLIYIDLNGMTRMRVIALLGITCVVAGFVLVVIKLLKDKGFVWLLHRQLWVPAGAVIVYAMLPVDWIVNRYNASRVLADHPAPAVQIIAQRSTAEGMLPVVDLVNSEDEKIREGICALLALWARELELVPSSGSGSAERASYSENAEVWMSDLGHSSPWAEVRTGFSQRDSHSETSGYNFQYAELLLRKRLLQTKSAWLPYHESPERRERALNEFFRYAYQWY